MDTKKSVVLSQGHDLFEANTAVLHNGQWVMIARPEGDICWSDDKGKTWTKPATFGIRMFAPSLYVLPDGSLFIVDQDTGGHRSEDARNMSLRCLHLRIRSDHSGIELLPVS